MALNAPLPDANQTTTGLELGQTKAQAISANHQSVMQEKPTKSKQTTPTSRHALVTTCSDGNTNAKESVSVIGSMTTWVPPTANLTTNRSELDNVNTSPLQTIAIVAGRKYIMVPKTNLMSVSPSGEIKTNDNNGTYNDDNLLYNNSM